MPASLLSAKIRGLRSYSPLEERTQQIDFVPLTLIVGTNGSGKTTILESLKFMISGDEPPLSDYRRSFLHTPRTGDKPWPPERPYASIDLEFLNSAGEVCVARREILKPASSKAGSTPSVSSSYRVANKRWTHVHKQDEWNKTMPLLFNLPNAALLNHVILCHQEENLWCMGESAKVKLIFDKIFGCEQYKREITFIDTEIKSCKQTITLSEKDIELVKDRVHRKKVLESKLRDRQADNDDLTRKIEDLEHELEMLDSERDDCRGQLSSIEEKAKAYNDTRQKVRYLEERCQTLKDDLKDRFIDPSVMSDSELKTNIQNHLKLVETAKRRQEAIKSRDFACKDETKRLERKRDLIQSEINELKVIELKSGETHASIVEGLQAIKENHLAGELKVSDIKACLDVLEETEKQLIQNKSEQAEAEDNLASEQRALAQNIAELEGIYQGLLNKIEGKESSLQKLNDQLAQADPITKDLIHVLDNLDKAKQVGRQMPVSDLTRNLSQLLIDSEKVLENLLRQVRDEGVLKLKTEILKESQTLEKSRAQLEAAETQRKDISTRRDLVEADHLKVKSASKEAHNQLITFKNARRNIFNAFEKYQNEQKILSSKNLAAKIAELESSNEKIQTKKLELAALSDEASNLNESVSQSHSQYELHKSNMQLREATSELKKVQEEMSNLDYGEKELLEVARWKASIEELERKSFNLRDRRSQLAGTKSQMNTQVREIKTELGSYTNVDQRLSELLGKLICNRIMQEDLEKLKACFNQSVIEFHEHMITRINEVLRARWKQIYQGSDIETIELVDEETMRGKTKVLNYYVAMRKNGQRMKMRDKSSAGQKALASIILRMTLAELFVKDFVFIALDEPTANLDLANVQSLAKTIGSYVKRRTSKGINIQWIIITHDEQFLKALNVECSPYFYRVRMDRQSCSNIIKISFQEAQNCSEEEGLTSTPESGSQSAT